MGKNHNHHNQQKDPMTNVKTMSREGMKIMRDIAFGTYKFYEQGHVFRNQNFVRATAEEVEKRMIEAQYIIYSIRAAYNNIYDPNAMSILARWEKKYVAYYKMYEALCSTFNTGDTGFIQGLYSSLAPYKYYI